MTSSYTYNLVMKPGADGAVEDDKHAARGWNKVVKENQLAVKDRVRVWSFRVNSRLYFALTKVVDDDDDIIDIHDQVQVEEERMKISTELKLSIN
ncbi:hypothetical protein TorRG33x02_065420 [Trema orientale]|uniref:B3 DNA binding domain containing protein n=1 Tax=Trema orientale TaxID=63057 RepID=A0A2P5FIL9_TREOI|nr:hypothetical protein TorRG33x02_065420 [Trema orientale]